MTAEQVDALGLRAAPAALEEERDFLIRSLRDLESERAAGDIDDVDYATLRDDYMARAARLLRKLEEPGPLEALGPLDGSGETGGGPRVAGGDGDEPGAGRAPAGLGPPTGAGPGGEEATGPGRGARGGALGQAEERHPQRRRGWRRQGRRPWKRWQIAAVAAIVVILAGLVGWQVGHNSGTRQPGETITGGNLSTGGAMSAQELSSLLSAAEAHAVSDPVDALKDYNKILAAYPDQPQALTEEGWIYAQAGLASQAEASLAHAEAADPSYDPPYGYLGIVYLGQDNYTGAVTQLTYYLGHGPDAALKSEAACALATAKVDAAATASAKSSGAPASPTTTTAAACSASSSTTAP